MSQQSQQKTTTNQGYGTGSYLQSWTKWLQDSPRTNQNDQHDTQITQQTSSTHAKTTELTRKATPSTSFWQTFSSGASSVVRTATTKGFMYLSENIARGAQVTLVKSTLHDRIPISHAHRALLMASIARIPYSIPRYTQQSQNTRQEPEENITANWKETVSKELQNYGFELVSTSTPTNQIYSPYPSYLICKDVLTQEVVVAVSGTATAVDVYTDSMYMPALVHGEIQGHKGALTAARALFKEMETILHELHLYLDANDTRHEDARPRQSLHFTGHSLGGAIVSLLAVLAIKEGLADKFAIESVYTFGSPLVFYRSVTPETVGLPSEIFHHFVNDLDAVPRLLGSAIILTMIQDLASMVGMDEKNFKASTLSTVQEYKPYGILWYIMDQTSVIYRVMDSATQGILLQFSGLNWTNQSLEHHKLLRYIEEIKKAIENHKCEDPSDAKSHPEDVTVTAEMLTQMDASI